MSNLEIERAAMGPRRWLRGAFQNLGSVGFKEMLLHRRRSRSIKALNTSIFHIVPGGRYLVVADNGLFIWDLGYVSAVKVDCKIIASAALGKHLEFFMVQATPDGKGLVILSCYTR
jgi:hypothetical protein